MKKTSKISVGEYAGKFKSEFMRNLLTSYMPKNFRLMPLLVSLTTFFDGNGDLPNISSHQVVENMVEKYLSLGGKIIYQKEVKSFDIANKKITGVNFCDNTHIDVDLLIPTMDINHLYALLPNDYLDKGLKKLTSKEKDNPLMATCYFSYIVKKDVAEKLPCYSFIRSRKFIVANKENDLIALRKYDYYLNHNNNDYIVFICPLLQNGDDYTYWKKLYTEDKKGYQKEKERIAQEILDIALEKFPILKDNIEILDTATPVTYERYCHAYKGSYMAFMPTPKTKNIALKLRIKGLANTYLAGQWLTPPGGTPSAIINGKFAVQRICRDLKIDFKDK